MAATHGGEERTARDAPRSELPVSPPPEDADPDLTERRFRLLVDASPMGVWLSEPTTGVIYTNRQLQEQLGATFEQTLGYAIEDFIHEADRDRLAQAVYRIWTERQPFDEEIRVVRPGGDARTIRARGRVMVDERGEAAGVVGTTEDVTEQRRNQQLRRQLVERLVEMADKERAKLSSDLHNGPAQDLAAGRILMERLEQRVADDELRRDLAAIRSLLDQTMRDLRLMMNELSPPELRTEGLAPAVRAVARELEARTETRVDVVDRLEREPSREARDVCHHLVQEALANIRRHADATRVVVELIESDGGLQITVTDDGRGIDPDALESQVFDEVGLSSMRDRAEAVGGRCQIRPEPERGASVVFWIPWSLDLEANDRSDA